MGLGSRTPTTSSTRNSTTPTADSGVCAISPSDLVGYTGNALNRIKELEQRVAELEAKNTEFNQLSDASQQVGWVGGVTYMGTAGWTQTEYGTLIPPPGVSFSSLGFTLSDGNTYPFVVMDENGVLQYGFTATGGTGGALASGNNGCDLFNSADQITYTTTAAVKVFENFGETDVSGLVSQNVGTGELTFASTGLYLVGYTMAIQLDAAAGADKKFSHGFGDGSGWYSELFQSEEITGQSGLHSFSGTYVFYNDGSPNSLFLQCNDSGTAGSTRTVDLRALFIIKIRSL
jgi:hypothetical protein